MKNFKSIVLDVLFFGSMIFWIVMSNECSEGFKWLGMISNFIMFIPWVKGSNTAKKGLEFIAEMFEEGVNEMYGEEE